MPVNFEFKARSNNNTELEQILQSFQPRFVGEDTQTDTYFNVPNGRMKLREGNIENALIHYHRNNIAGAKQSDVLLYQHQPSKALKKILINAIGIKTIVLKRRRIWFVDNVKFHFDHVDGLGDFIEVEAIDADGSRSIQQLQEQCSFYASIFQIAPECFVAESYSDLLLAVKSKE
ncbi:class IV adenylate cyclase [Chitinophagaceae bacterium LB-8]|jgi:adenylate cyclase, class 2|uniref:Class IV adenylate cyclase n=1 Tax=Paraflavisolibacter caeni TaxID=2982496 RepID=A0A9X2Y2M8_9BACT|nr:class IV adenylate cyclase [Paraflavisolibacter caeni]MCU7552768.1 class IV adenylate cyclase [Paraflavisolibacter caeni]